MKKKSLSCLIISAFVITTAFSSCGGDMLYDSDKKSIRKYDESSICYENESNDKEQSISNDEEYSDIKENGYKSVEANPLSTFSIDVDTASYSNVRRMITDYGTVVDEDAVRIEEMINYFDYNYAQPKNDDPFSVTTELSNCTWNPDYKLLSIGIQGKEFPKEETPASNIVFLLDVSGSMSDADKLPLMVNAFKMLSENLTENDRVSVVTYAGSDEILLQGEKGNNSDKIISTLGSLSAGGSTYGSAGINTAYELAEKYFIENGNNRVILATDGDLNVGVTTENELEKLISAKRDSGIYLSVLGFGTGNIKDNKMETLADNGNGNYAYIDSINEAHKVLVEEMGGTLHTIAKDVKLQVEFNPERVSDYRLIGYENRVMSDKDFYDDKKDAGEIGAGHTVTALYEVKLSKDESIPLKYQSDTQESSPESEYSDEWLTVSINYKEPDGNESKLLKYPVKDDCFTDFPTENMQFASCVAQFGLLLRNSENKGEASYNDILDTLASLDCVSEDKYKKEFMELVQKASEYR